MPTLSRHDLHVKTQRNHDLECQVAKWEPQALSKSITTENSLSRQNSPVAHATLSCAHPSRVHMPVVSARLCHTRALPCWRHSALPHCCDIEHYVTTWKPYVLRFSVATKRTQSRHKFSPCWPTLSQPKNTLS